MTAGKSNFPKKKSIVMEKAVMIRVEFFFVVSFLFIKGQTHRVHFLRFKAPVFFFFLCI